MKIVVLDGCAANSGDISWDSIGKYGELTVYDRTDRSEVVSRIGDAEIITTNKTVIDRAVIEACPNLRYIGVLATGYNVVDVEAAHEHGIVVTMFRHTVRMLWRSLHLHCFWNWQTGSGRMMRQ